LADTAIASRATSICRPREHLAEGGAEGGIVAARRDRPEGELFRRRRGERLDLADDPSHHGLGRGIARRQARAAVGDLAVDEGRQRRPALERLAALVRGGDRLFARDVGDVEMPAAHMVDVPQLEPADPRLALGLEPLDHAGEDGGAAAGERLGGDAAERVEQAVVVAPEGGERGRAAVRPAAVVRGRHADGISRGRIVGELQRHHLGRERIELGIGRGRRPWSRRAPGKECQRGSRSQHGSDFHVPVSRPVRPAPACC
jgi:hypothetical protein